MHTLFCSFTSLSQSSTGVSFGESGNILRIFHIGVVFIVCTVRVCIHTNAHTQQTVPCDFFTHKKSIKLNRILFFFLTLVVQNIFACVIVQVRWMHGIPSISHRFDRLYFILFYWFDLSWRHATVFFTNIRQLELFRDQNTHKHLFVCIQCKNVWTRGSIHDSEWRDLRAWARSHETPCWWLALCDLHMYNFVFYHSKYDSQKAK